MSDWLELDEKAEVNVEEIMDRIRNYISERRTQQDLESSLAGDISFQGNLSAKIYESLARATRANKNAGLPLDVRSSPWPIVGPVIDSLRRSIHQLVLFYVNKSIANQVSINADVLKALGWLVADVESQQAAQAQIETMRGELANLRERPSELETK